MSTLPHGTDDEEKAATALAECLKGVLDEGALSPDVNAHDAQSKNRDELVAAIKVLVKKDNVKTRANTYRLIISLRTFLGIIGQPSSKGNVPLALSDLYTRVLNECDEDGWNLYESAIFTVVPGDFDSSGRDLFVGYCADDFFVAVRELTTYLPNKDRIQQSIKDSINHLLKAYTRSEGTLSDHLVDVFLNPYSKEQVKANKLLAVRTLNKKKRESKIIYGLDSTGTEVYPAFQFMNEGGIDPFVEKMLAELGAFTTLKDGDGYFLQPWGVAYWIYQKWVEWDKSGKIDLDGFVIDKVKNSRVYIEDGLGTKEFSDLEGALDRALTHFQKSTEDEKSQATRFRDLSADKDKTFYRVVKSDSHWCRFSQRSKQGESGRFTLSRDKWAGTLYLTRQQKDAMRETLEHDLVIGLKDVTNKSIATVTWTFPEKTYLCVLPEVFSKYDKNDDHDYTKLSWEQAQVLGDKIFDSQVKGILYGTQKAVFDDYALFGSGSYPPVDDELQVTTKYLVESYGLWTFLEERQEEDPHSVYLGRYPDDVQLKKQHVVRHST